MFPSSRPAPAVSVGGCRSAGGPRLRRNPVPTALTYLHQFIDSVGHALRGFSELLHGPVRGVALGHVGGSGMIN